MPPAAENRCDGKRRTAPRADLDDAVNRHPARSVHDLRLTRLTPASAPGYSWLCHALEMRKRTVPEPGAPGHTFSKSLGRSGAVDGTS